MRVPGRRVGNWRGILTTPFPACGFPALRSPARFEARVMRFMPVGPVLRENSIHVSGYSDLIVKFVRVKILILWAE